MLDHLRGRGNPDAVAGVAPLSGATPLHEWPLAWAADRLRAAVAQDA
jgi:hypothetical protein